METLIWTHSGLGQYYIWNGTLRQVLPESREEPPPTEPDRTVCQREDRGSPRGKPYHGSIHIWDRPQGIKPYEHLAQYRG